MTFPDFPASAGKSLIHTHTRPAEVLCRPRSVRGGPHSAVHAEKGVGGEGYPEHDSHGVQRLQRAEQHPEVLVACEVRDLEQHPEERV